MPSGTSSGHSDYKSPREEDFAVSPAVIAELQKTRIGGKSLGFYWRGLWGRGERAADESYPPTCDPRSLEISNNPKNAHAMFA